MDIAYVRWAMSIDLYKNASFPIGQEQWTQPYVHRGIGVSEGHYRRSRRPITTI